MPSKHVVINFGKGSKLILRGCKDLELGFNQLIGSKSETHIRLNDGAVWNCNNGGWLFYNTVLEVKEGAVLDTGFFSMNGGSVIIVDRHITIGEDAMLGRNIIIYDSDFHTISKNGIPCNEPEPVYIGNHVWLTTNIVVLKGAKIESGSLVAANTVISKAMPGRSIIAANSVGKVIKDNVEWSRERCPR